MRIKKREEARGRLFVDFFKKKKQNKMKMEEIKPQEEAVVESFGNQQHHL